MLNKAYYAPLATGGNGGVSMLNEGRESRVNPPVCVPIESVGLGRLSHETLTKLSKRKQGWGTVCANKPCPTHLRKERATTHEHTNKRTNERTSVRAKTHFGGSPLSSQTQTPHHYVLSHTNA